MSVYGAKHTHCSDSAVCSYLEGSYIQYAVNNPLNLLTLKLLH